MMEGNWERVSHGKKPKNKLSKSEKRKVQQKMLTVDDLSPVARSSVYNAAVSDSSDSSDEFVVRPSASGGRNGVESTVGGDKKKEGKGKKQQQQQPHNNKEILQSLRLARVEQAYRQSKATIPDSPLAWLIDICAVIDLDLNYDKKEEWNFEDLDRPAHHLPAACRQFLTDLLTTVSDDVKRRFFIHACQRLASLAEKRQAGLGTRAVLQLTAKQLPQMPNHPFCSEKLSCLAQSSRNSAPALTATLWSACQCAFRDKASGLRLVMDCLLPHLIRHKPSCHQVLDLLEDFGGHVSKERKCSKLSAKDAVLLIQLVNDSSLQQNTRDRLSRVLRQLRPLVIGLGSSDKNLSAASVVYDAAAAASSDKQPALRNELTKLLKQMLTNNSKLLIGLANDKMYRSAATAKLDSELVAMATVANGGVDSDSRRLLAETLLKQHKESLPADVRAQLLARGGRSGGGCGQCFGRLVAMVTVMAMLALAAACGLAVTETRQLPEWALPVQSKLESIGLLPHLRLCLSRAGQIGRFAYDSALPAVHNYWVWVKLKAEQAKRQSAPAYWAAHDRIGAFYADTALPMMIRIGDECVKLYELYARDLLLAACDGAAAVVKVVEAEMHTHLPSVATALSSAVNATVTCAAAAANSVTNSVTNSVMTVYGMLASA